MRRKGIMWWVNVQPQMWRSGLMEETPFLRKQLPFGKQAREAALLKRPPPRSRGVQCSITGAAT